MSDKFKNNNKQQIRKFDKNDSRQSSLYSIIHNYYDIKIYTFSGHKY